MALAENHPAGRKNRDNESVLPNGQVRGAAVVQLALPRTDYVRGGLDLEAAAPAALLCVQDSDRGERTAEPAGGASLCTAGAGELAHSSAAQDNTAARQMNQRKVPPLPFLLSSLITSRPPRKARP